MKKEETMSDVIVRVAGEGAAKEFAKFVEVADSLPGLPAVEPAATRAPLQTGEDFDMFGYDLLAQVQHVTDDYVRLFVLHNNSSHVLVAEAHAMSEPSDTVQEPARLVAAFPYFGDGDWRVAYRLALAEAVRQAHKDDVPPAAPRTERERLSDIAQHVEPRD